MAKPGRSHRKGITLMELAARYPDETSAREWFEAVHWPDGKMFCLRCGSDGVYRCKHKTMPYRWPLLQEVFQRKDWHGNRSEQFALENVGMGHLP